METFCKCCSKPFIKRETSIPHVPRRLRSNDTKRMNQTFCDKCCERIYRDIWIVGYNAGLRKSVSKRKEEHNE
jgi:hypothetical protein